MNGYEFSIVIILGLIFCSLVTTYYRKDSKERKEVIEFLYSDGMITLERIAKLIKPEHPKFFINQGFVISYRGFLGVAKISRDINTTIGE